MRTIEIGAIVDVTLIEILGFHSRSVSLALAFVEIFPRDQMLIQINVVGETVLCSVVKTRSFSHSPSPTLGGISGCADAFFPFLPLQSLPPAPISVGSVLRQLHTKYTQRRLAVFPQGKTETERERERSLVA